MWHMLATMRQNLQNMRKSPRVADESMVNIGGGNLAEELPIYRRQSSRSWKGFSVIVSVVILPFSVLSCFSQPQVHGADGVWMSGDFAQITEMNHLMYVVLYYIYYECWLWWRLARKGGSSFSRRVN